MSHPQAKTADTILVMVHGTAVTEPVRARTAGVSKALAAELALKALEDESSDYHLSRLCDCKATESQIEPTVGIGEEVEEREDDGGEGGVEDLVQKDETEEGFASLAQRLVNTGEEKPSGAGVERGESSDMDISEDEIGVH